MSLAPISPNLLHLLPTPAQLQAAVLSSNSKAQPVRHGDSLRVGVAGSLLAGRAGKCGLDRVPIRLGHQEGVKANGPPCAVVGHDEVLICVVDDDHC
eukprot:767336-Hanusia_phi.AAC.4